VTSSGGGVRISEIPEPDREPVPGVRLAVTSTGRDPIEVTVVELVPEDATAEDLVLSSSYRPQELRVEDARLRFDVIVRPGETVEVVYGLGEAADGDVTLLLSSPIIERTARLETVDGGAAGAGKDGADQRYSIRRYRAVAADLSRLEADVQALVDAVSSDLTMLESRLASPDRETAPDSGPSDPVGSEASGRHRDGRVDRRGPIDAGSRGSLTAGCQRPTMFSTGLPALDDRLGGGVPAGSLAALTAPPDSQSELLLYEAAAANPTRYLSTFRPVDEIREVMRADVAESTPVERVRDDRLLEDPGAVFDDLDGDLLVIDTATELERAGREQYRRALDVLKRRLRATDSAALLHCLDIEPAPMRRGLTLGRADTVFRLRLVGLPERVTPRLLVTKLRGGTAPETSVRLAFEQSARVVEADQDG
jgi:KaiC/GvpD/RAD55 family RecA-like ATPase